MSEEMTLPPIQDNIDEILDVHQREIGRLAGQLLILSSRLRTREAALLEAARTIQSLQVRLQDRDQKEVSP